MVRVDGGRPAGSARFRAWEYAAMSRLPRHLPVGRLAAAVAAALVLLLYGSRTRAAGRSDGPPNIILILADDLGYGDLSCYGQARFVTPHLDRLADEGMRFTDFYAGSTVCAPSRCALMTGLHTGHCTVRGNGAGMNQSLRDDDTTVAEILKSAGYVTGLIGKWGLGDVGNAEPGLPLRQGFDYFFGYLNQVHAHYYYTDYLWRNTGRIDLPGNRDGKREQYTHDLMEREALAFIRRHAERPFFLYLALTLSHAEMLVPEDSMKPFEGRWPEKPFVSGRPYGNGYASSPAPRAAFAGMVTRLDRTIGRLSGALRELDLDEHTLIIFSSDNGPHLEGGADPAFFDANGPLRGYKRDLYEGGVRVPTIARWPGRIEAGAVSDEPLAFWDILPTAAEIAGVEAPSGLDGLSFLPTLLGRDDEQTHHHALYWEFYEQGGRRALRAGPWKLVQNGLPHGARELYDLRTDPGETNDTAADHPDVLQRLTRLMDAAHVDNEHWSFSQFNNGDPAPRGEEEADGS
jgi:arylsulfatase A